ncbi:hypothetical protein INH39_08365 [Massilia violaceinigra]|uniref:Uncharacterized protein n=1 Tax=Massilia violaceinigra TaxID=2045208 RepID=A0ABY4AAD7_9BURK|nr:hypothetical protein [Massilia violaceinigra]UOD31681.1 hypothetical protein INH39_08365 [Massilia violaceinigra]
MSMLLFRKGMSGSRQLVNLTFYSNATWTCPATTTRVSVTAQGSSGSPQSTTYRGATCTEVTYINDGQFPEGLQSGNFGWDAVRGETNFGTATRLNNGIPSFFRLEIVQYSHWSFGEKYRRTSTLVPLDNFIPGSASVSFQGAFPASGPILSNASASLTFNYVVAATNGLPTRAFGNTFPGGVGGPASASALPDTVVVPGSPYPLTIPSGGWVSLSYYQ